MPQCNPEVSSILEVMPCWMCPYLQTTIPATSQGLLCHDPLLPLSWLQRSGPGPTAGWETRSRIPAGWGSRAPCCQPGCHSSSKANKVENGSSLRVAELETEPPSASSDGSAGAAPGSERGAAPCPPRAAPCPGRGTFITDCATW